jgi:putative GTP pyrophosphokinase
MKRTLPAKTTPLDRDRAKTLYELRRPLYEETLQALYRRVRRLLENSGFSPSVKYRVKRFEAYYEKLRRPYARGKSGKAAPISDMLGLRIVCPFLEDIETIKELIAANFEVTEVDWKAAQHSFREFGYDSVHLLVKLDKDALKHALPGTRRVCEVQLRTILQDAWAEVEHELVYKSDISIPNESIRRKLASLNATLTLSDLIFQEIRDYQKAIRQRGRKRQEKITETLDSLDVLTMSYQGGDRPGIPDNGSRISSTSKSQLEKTMLLALDAHSGHDLETAINLYGELLGMRLTRDIRSLVYNHRGMAYFAKGDLKRAIDDFSKAISYNPENSRGYANRGLCYRIGQKHERALSDFDTAVSIDPFLSETYYNRAQTYHEMGLYHKALNDSEKTLEINPGHQAARDLAGALRNRLA